jgi:hypothetical protein
MATTTPNYGWVVPTSTDLVKDGATAIETLGDSIDASFVGLKGGTTGQVLSKTSNTDLAFTWVAADDTNAIQNAIVTTKGDLIGATGNATPARLGVGTNGQILTADSTAATGLKWAAAASGFSGARMWNTTTQNVSTATLTSITWDSESYDTNSYHSTSTNTSRITIPTTGYYRMDALVMMDANATGGRFLTIRKNGTTDVAYYELGASTQSAVGTTMVLSCQLSCTAADYFEVQVYQTSGGTRNTYYAIQGSNFFSIQSLGA